MKIVIELPPITKKNSQRILANRRTGKPFISPSAKYKAFERAAGYYITPCQPQQPIDYPVNVQCVYYMKDRRRSDLVNLQEATLDVLVRWNVLQDDNYKIVASMDGSRVEVDKDRPRTEITITQKEVNGVNDGYW